MPKLLPLIIAALSLIDGLASPSVEALRTPGGGIQPQVAIDKEGTAHLISLRGDPAAANIFYQRRLTDGSFSGALQVNRAPGSATVIGTIRGPQISAAHGYVHVVWNGHAPKNGSYLEAPMLYSRLAEKGNAFEIERNLITSARGLDGGGSVTADEKGNVLVFWHAPQPGNTNGEVGRALFVARSKDDGQSFSPEALATTEATGACACCGMKAFADPAGNIFAAFRGASDMTTRDEIFLAGRVDSALKRIFRHSWKIPMCPMSSVSFAAAPSQTLVAWETENNVYYASISDSRVGTPVTPGPKRKRKHPSLAVNKLGEVVFAWTEGTAWAKGGSVVWQVYNRDFQPVGPEGRADGLPAWSSPAALAKPDGSFTIFY